MQVKEEFYGDGMPQIHFAGGLVRMDFATFQPDPGGKEPKPEKNFRLVMNMQSFLSTFDTMQKLAERMVEIGVLKRNLTEKVDD